MRTPDDFSFVLTQSTYECLWLYSIWDLFSRSQFLFPFAAKHVLNRGSKQMLEVASWSSSERGAPGTLLRMLLLLLSLLTNGDARLIVGDRQSSSHFCLHRHHWPPVEQATCNKPKQSIVVLHRFVSHPISSKNHAVTLEPTNTINIPGYCYCCGSRCLSNCWKQTLL